MSPGERAVAFLDALLLFKLKNIHLIRALELGPAGPRSEHYKWMHRLLQHFLENAAPEAKPAHAIFAAHVLLAGSPIDLVKSMIAGGLSIDTIRQAQAAHARAMIDTARSTDRS
jgi:phosphoribosylanthranilate isomerase